MNVFFFSVIYSVLKCTEHSSGLANINGNVVFVNKVQCFVTRWHRLEALKRVYHLLVFSHADCSVDLHLFCLEKC